MNDEELNELIARHEHENAIFREMDAKRERETLENWRAAGNRGKPPQPLMQLEELPECYQTDQPFEVKEIDDINEGRGQRRRNIVSYNDGLSDDAWAMVCCRVLVYGLEFTFYFFRLWRRAKTCKNLLSVPGTRKIVVPRTSC